MTDHAEIAERWRNLTEWGHQGLWSSALFCLPVTHVLVPWCLSRHDMNSNPPSGVPHRASEI